MRIDSLFLYTIIVESEDAMPRKFSSRRPLTDDEQAEIQRKIASDPDNPELTDEQVAGLRPRSCENMISDAGIAQQRWLAPAGARGQAAIACISGLTPKILISRFIL